MPRMPDWTDAPQSKPTSGAVARAPKEFISEAVGRLGDTMRQEASADANLNARLAREGKADADALDLARARADWNKRRLNEEDGFQFETNPKIETWESGYGKNISKHKAASASLINDPVLRLKFEAEADGDIAEGTVRIRNRGRDLVNNQRRAAGLQSIEDNLILATRPGLPEEERDKLFARSRADIDNMVASGTLTPEQAIETRRKFGERFASAKVREDIQKDPANALRHLQGSAANETYYAKLRGKESGDSDTAKASTSSATGRYQFTEGTWEGLRKAHPELALTKDGRTNADQQERAVRVFTEENARHLESNGIPATEANLYLAHFMGASGAVAMLQADPNAEAATLFPEAAGSNESIFYAGKGKTQRARTVAEVIALQTRNFSGQSGPAPDYYQMVSPEERITYSTAAEAEWAARNKADRESDALTKYQLKSSLEDDITQIRETGKPTNVDPKTVLDVLGTDGMAKWIDDRKAAVRTYEAVTSMDTMTNDQIETHLQGLEPVDGTPDFDTAQKTYDAAEKRANQLRDMRLKDPAKSVDSSPMVREAKKALNPDDPTTLQGLVRARLAAQEQVGLPKAMRQPVTRSEAKQITAPIEQIINMADARLIAATFAKDMDGATRRATKKEIRRQAEAQVAETLAQIDEAYGPYAEKVLAFAISESVKDRDVGDLTARVLKKIVANERITAADFTSIDDAKDASAAEKAMDGTPSRSNREAAEPPSAPEEPSTPWQSKKPFGRYGNAGGIVSIGKPPEEPPTKKGKPSERKGYPWPSRPDVEKLLKFQVTPAEFDKLYGPGRAAEWLP